MRGKPDRSLIVLGRYLSLVFTLPAYVLAGYLVGAFADHWLHFPLVRALGVILGMAAGLIQIFRELARDAKRGETQRKT